MEQSGEIERTGKPVGLACLLNELNEFFVQREFTSSYIVRSEFVPEAISENVEEYRLACKAVLDVSNTKLRIAFYRHPLFLKWALLGICPLER